jgi:hypothetical protein
MPQNRQEMMTDEAIRAKTGKGWDHWFTALDKAGAGKRDHAAIAALLQEKMGLSPWYSQMIAVSYERVRGIRAMNQKCDGEFSVSVTKVMPVSLAKLFAVATAKQAAWFPKGAFAETSRTKDKYWRGRWKGDGRLAIGFIAKGPGKAQIAVDSGKLAGADIVEKERTAWKAALEKLSGLLAG